MARDLSDEEVTLCTGIFPAARWSGGQMTEQGSAYRVAISAPVQPGSPASEQAGRAVIRFGRRPDSAAALERMGRLHPALARGLAGTGVRIPEPLGTVHQTGLGPAMAFSFIDGRDHPPARGNPGEFARGGDDLGVMTKALADVLEALQQVPIETVEADLAPPFSYRGQWTTAKTATVLEFIGEQAPELMAATSLLLRTLINHPLGFDSKLGLVHGDLAGQNMVWNEELSAVTGVLDWDLASRWDPAINLMHLSLWHGEQILEPVVASLQERGLLEAEGIESPSMYVARARFWSGVWAAENLWHAADRQRQAALGIAGFTTIKPGALRRLFTKLGPRLSAGSEAVERIWEAGLLL
ncbi:phosphotransferase family protein [Micrococcoides hystricis]|uniref:Phosphotransferase family protein n=1 Tax=Micrococcoides hystricis TaxID=1572761 RepID=A0ABV6PAE2_9MICC